MKARPVLLLAVSALSIGMLRGAPGAPRRVPLTDPAIFRSPYCWRTDDAGDAVCPAGGGYLKFDVTGTAHLGLRVDTAINRGLSALQMPAVKVIVSGPARDGLAHYVAFPADDRADTAVPLADGLDPGTHYRVTLFAVGGDERAMSGWSGTIFQTQINRLVLDAGGVVLPPALRPRRALFLGASYEQAFFGFLREDEPMYRSVDPSLAWPFFVAFAFDCEYGQVGIGSQGWARFGNGGYPAFPYTWNRFDARHAKTFGPDLDYVFVHLAENDAAQPDAAVERAVAAWIPAARAAFGPRTRLFIILSLPQIKSGPIRAGVAAAADPLTYVLDPGREYQRTVFAGGPTWASPGDGIHLDAVHQGLFTAFVTRQAQACLDRGTP
ncbi:MAG TPA: hypothetical protein VFE31_13785 [Opitutaceae bacterium]|jgi:hypothetical protein|nr:hypothetical protein [Opitutaceae bacterium]